MARVEVITGPERRRRWTADQKRAIIQELLAAHEDGSAFWLYTLALVAFRESEDRPQRWSRMPGQRTSMCLPSWPERSPR
jgi:hypothetical protein